jgi:hypothetical protein
MTYIAEQAQQHPRYAGVTELGMGLGGVGLAGYTAVRFLMAGPALTGAAGALTRSAAALTVAAERLGIGGTAGMATGAGAGVTASWLMRALPWLGGVGGFLYGMWPATANAGEPNRFGELHRQQQSQYLQWASQWHGPGSQNITGAITASGDKVSASAKTDAAGIIAAIH